MLIYCQNLLFKYPYPLFRTKNKRGNLFPRRVPHLPWSRLRSTSGIRSHGVVARHRPCHTAGTWLQMSPSENLIAAFTVDLNRYQHGV